MTLPIFSSSDDPGPDFAELLQRQSRPPVAFEMSRDESVAIPHGTTVIAVRFADGVLMAGDRRATSGNLISHRTIEKVFPADHLSAVGIAGAAGPAIEMVKLFQLQLEHYEKVEGSLLSLEGKANQLARMVRAHLPAAMQGLGVIPLFAGFDEKRRVGRLFQYDLTGGSYEEIEYASIGSGGLHAGTVLKLGWNEDLDASGSIDLALKALITAADEDSATGGPDLRRAIFPAVATIDTDGFKRISDEDLRGRVEQILSEVRPASTPGEGASR